MITFLKKLIGKKSSQRSLSFDLITDSQPRITITINGIKRKIFTYFPASSDGSIAFHFYLPGKYSGEISLGSDFGGGVIDLNEMTRRDHFLIHKINFHRSGEVTTKNSVGQKFSSQKSYSVSLENFKDGQNDLCFLEPVTWDTYPIVQDDKKYIELTNRNLNVLSPVIQLYVCYDEREIRWSV